MQMINTVVLKFKFITLCEEKILIYIFLSYILGISTFLY